MASNVAQSADRVVPLQENVRNNNSQEIQPLDAPKFAPGLAEEIRRVVREELQAHGEEQAKKREEVQNHASATSVLKRVWDSITTFVKKATQWVSEKMHSIYEKIKALDPGSKWLLLSAAFFFLSLVASAATIANPTMVGVWFMIALMGLTTLSFGKSVYEGSMQLPQQQVAVPQQA